MKYQNLANEPLEPCLIHIAVRRNNIPGSFTQRRPDFDEIARLLELGCSYNEICRRLSTSSSTVAKVAKERGLAIGSGHRR